jgi:predicted acetyltransferase
MTALDPAFTIRAITDEEFAAYARQVALQFGEGLHDDDIDRYRSIADLDRTFACYEGDTIIGTAENLTFTMGLPGGAPAGCAGLTAVGVHPTRRRRGILTALMRTTLDDAHERGEPFAALYASEAPIYGRFGYGPAAPTVNLAIDRPWGRLRRPAAAVDEIRLVDAEEALATCPAVYDRVQAVTPGMMSRSAALWDYAIGSDLERHRRGFGPRAHAVIDGRGYAFYRIKEGWSENVPDSTLRVVELMATDAEAYAALWQLCLQMDLIAHVEATLRPPDEPLQLAVDDTARLRARVSEPLYLRLVQLDAALTSRSYATADSVVLDVRDAQCPWNDGRWRLETSPDGATCERSAEEPDVTLDTAELATCFLGGVRASVLGRARRIEQHGDGVLQRLDQLFSADPAPWNPSLF